MPAGWVDQARADVQSAVQANRKAPSLLDYRTSGATASDIFANIQTQRNKAANEALCSALEELPPEDLAIFDEPIQTSPLTPELPCGAILKTRLRDFWEKSRIAFLAYVKQSRGLAAVRRPLSKIEVRKAGDPNFMGTGEVALTFEGGPHPSRSARILDILKAKGMKATFFTNGKDCRANPTVVKRMALEGQSLGSSSMVKNVVTRMPLNQAEKDIITAVDAVDAASGVTPRLFRFPYGAGRPELREYVRAQGLVEVPATIDSRDWQIHEVSALYDHVLKAVTDAKGGVLSFHDSNEQTVLALPALIDEMQARGLKLVVIN